MQVASTVVVYRVAFQRARLVDQVVVEFARQTGHGVREMVDLYEAMFGNLCGQLGLQYVA